MPSNVKSKNFRSCCRIYDCLSENKFSWRDRKTYTACDYVSKVDVQLFIIICFQHRRQQHCAPKYEENAQQGHQSRGHKSMSVLQQQYKYY